MSGEVEFIPGNFRRSCKKNFQNLTRTEHWKTWIKQTRHLFLQHPFFVLAGRSEVHIFQKSSKNFTFFTEILTAENVTKILEHFFVSKIFVCKNEAKSSDDQRNNKETFKKYKHFYEWLDMIHWTFFIWKYFEFRG